MNRYELGDTKPIYQCMCTDDDDGREDVWMDVSRESFEQISKRSDVRSRIVYAATPAAPVAQGLTDEQILSVLDPIADDYMLMDNKAGVVMAGRELIARAMLAQSAPAATAQSASAQQADQAIGWTDDADANAALLMLERLDVSGEDDTRVDAIAATIRRLASPAPAATAPSDGARQAEPVADSAGEAGGWMQSGGLLYRLTDEHRPQNRDEINVTMANGSRKPEDCAARASQILALIAAPAPSASQDKP